MGTQQNRLIETVLLSTQNICLDDKNVTAKKSQKQDMNLRVIFRNMIKFNFALSR